MRFNLHDFIIKGLIAAIGVQSDYWVILEAARWFDKGVLQEEDLIEIQRLIDEKNTPAPKPEPVIEEPIDEEIEPTDEVVEEVIEEVQEDSAGEE